MKRTLHIILAFLYIACFSCQKNETASYDSTEHESENLHQLPEKAVIKVSEELVERLEADAADVIPGADIRRTFPHGGKFEARMRKAGLHRWYDVEFNDSCPLTRGDESLLHIDGIELIEYPPAQVSSGESFPFNDPDLKKQWHYGNRGNVLTGLKAGCDINVFPAWERGIVGSDDVIVAVIDGGVDYNHEDLKDNIWHGTDTSGNLIYGYNFVTDKYAVNPDDHGTHVAGTIAALNNNDVGGSGIAGGDASKGIKGARIMSCQIFDGDDTANGATALVWAANNGAVIAQNSWGFTQADNPSLTDTPEYMKTAIDYFNDHAGCDENGNQRPDSPMKGGVVFFSSGNEGLSVGYPSSYEGCIAVSSVAGDYKLASYSNYGNWVDIAAPGGEASKNQLVYSTVTGNAYDSYQGTSMACPHVSGVAALILSEFGGQGYTREDLISRLLDTASDISLLSNEMGAGLVDASAAVARYGEDLPNVPVFVESQELSGTSLLMKYLIPEDNNGVECKSVDLYFGPGAFTELSDGLTKVSCPEDDLHSGDTVSFVIENLDFNTTYHFSVLSFDLYANASQLSENVSVTTRDNLPPVIEALDGTDVTLKKYMTKKLRFKISDPENEMKDVKYESATGFDVFSEDEDVFVITIDATKIAAGAYSSRITAEDIYGETTVCEISFRVDENQSPVLSSQMADVLFTARSKSRTIDLTEHFTDADGEVLTYSAETSSASVVKASVSKSTLTLNSSAFGEAVITVKASDAFSEAVVATFRVVVRDGTRAFDIYPNPVTDGRLYVRSSKATPVHVMITGSSGSVVYDTELTSDPFSPAVADLSRILPGIYNVKVTDESGKEFTQNIVKL